MWVGEGEREEREGKEKYNNRKIKWKDLFMLLWILDVLKDKKYISFDFSERVEEGEEKGTGEKKMQLT